MKRYLVTAIIVLLLAGTALFSMPHSAREVPPELVRPFLEQVKIPVQQAGFAAHHNFNWPPATGLESVGEYKFTVVSGEPAALSEKNFPDFTGEILGRRAKSPQDDIHL